MQTIGRKDRIDLPELKLFDIEAKIDTGAYGNALHCHHFEVILKEGKKYLSFKVLDPDHPEYEDLEFLVEHYRIKKVKSSSGEAELRYTIKTEIIIFHKSRIIEFSLTDRKNMKYPILLGRKFLTKRFLVDVRQKDLSFHEKKSQSN